MIMRILFILNILFYVLNVSSRASSTLECATEEINVIIDTQTMQTNITFNATEVNVRANENLCISERLEIIINLLGDKQLKYQFMLRFDSGQIFYLNMKDGKYNLNECEYSWSELQPLVLIIEHQTAYFTHYSSIRHPVQYSHLREFQVRKKYLPKHSAVVLQVKRYSAHTINESIQQNNDTTRRQTQPIQSTPSSASTTHPTEHPTHHPISPIISTSKNCKDRELRVAVCILSCALAISLIIIACLTFVFIRKNSGRGIHSREVEKSQSSVLRVTQKQGEIQYPQLSKCKKYNNRNQAQV